ncbi:TRAP transporter substrate-binding protein [Lentisphaerota bacterium WC36G]|nr:TRAP transporter substrate-binding protein [Lentisphaerae bacterium WC36]
MKKSVSNFLSGLLIGIIVSVSSFALFVKYNKNSGDGKKVLKLAHNQDNKHPVHLALVQMKKRLEELSNGTISMNIHGSSVLGNTANCIEQLSTGKLDLSTSSVANMEAFVPEMGLFSLPYIFEDGEHYWNVLNGKLGKTLLQAGESKKLRGLCYFDAGSRSFYTKNKAINTPDDLKGLKIRVMSSPIAIDMVKCLGGSATPIAFGELYGALQQGVVDGAENNPPSFYTTKHYNVCKFLSMDEHTRVPDTLLISTITWDKLSPQERKWLQIAADEASKLQRELWAKKTTDALKAVEEAGIKINYPDKKLFMEKVKPMYKPYEGSKIGNMLKEIDKLKKGK